MDRSRLRRRRISGDANLSPETNLEFLSECLAHNQSCHVVLEMNKTIESEDLSQNNKSTKSLLLWMDLVGMKLLRLDGPSECNECKPVKTSEETSFFGKKFARYKKTRANTRKPSKECLYCGTSNSNSNQSLPEFSIVWQRFSDVILNRLIPSKQANYIRNKKKLLWLVDMLILVGLLYLCCHHIVIAVLMYKTQAVQQKLNPQIRLGANKSDLNCVLSQDIYYNRTNGDYENYENFLFLYSLQNSLGAFLHVAPGYAIFLHMTLGAFSLTGMAFNFALLILTENLTIHHLSFVLSPLAEKRRLSKELLNMTEPLIESARLRSKLGLATNSFVQSQELNLELLIAKAKIKGQKIVNKRMRKRFCENYLDEQILPHLKYNSKIRRDEYILFCEILLQSLLLNSAELKPVATNRLIKVRRLHAIFIKLCNYINAAFIISALMVTIAVELNFRVRDRLRHFDCQKFAPTATPINSFAPLPELPNSQAKEAYLNYDGSFASLAYLAVNVELGLFTLRAFVHLLETVLLGAVALTLLEFYVNLYFQSFLDETSWLNSILEMIDEFSILMNKRNIMQEGGRLKLELGAKQAGFGAQLLETEANKSLLASYLQFELFKRQHKAYKLVADKILSTTLCLWLEALLLAYYVQVTMINSLAGGLIFFSALNIATLTVFQLCGAILTKKIERLMRAILKLLACSTQNSMPNSYPVELWRRQLLDEQNSVRTFSFKIVGVYVSYKRILAFNIYFICFIFFVLDKNGFSASFII